MKVYIVDDDGAMCGLMARKVERMGFEVFPSRDAKEVLENINHGDVLVTDMRMPYNGKGLIQAVHDRQILAPIVVVTGYPWEMDDDMRMLVVDVLTKPFDFDMLEASVLEAARHAEKMQDALQRLADEAQNWRRGA